MVIWRELTPVEGDSPYVQDIATSDYPLLDFNRCEAQDTTFLELPRSTFSNIFKQHDFGGQT